MSLTNTDPGFRAKIRAIAAAGCCLTEEEVYQLWKTYSRQCTDQSAILSEFIDWYADDLGAPKADLHRAIQ